jgi:hypothetical protein
MYTMNDPEVNQFLDSIVKYSTKSSYKTSMKFYLEFSGKTGKELLDIKKNDKDFAVENSLFAFKKWLLETKKTLSGKNYSSHFAVACVMTARSFYDYYRMPLVFRKQEAKTIKQSTRTTTDYLFDKEDLAKMALVGDLKQRYVLLVGKSVGLRASDFTQFTYGTFRSLKLDNDAPIAIGCINTIKENVPAYPFLDSDAIPIVKQILESNKERLDSDKAINDTEDNLSIVLQTLAKKAGIEPHGKRIRFHCLRKFTIDHLSALASESQWKQIVGKSIDEGAYVSQDQLRGIFLRAMPSMLINGNGIKAKKLMELENALLDSQKRLTSLETTNEVLRKNQVEEERKITTLDSDNTNIKKDYDNLNIKHETLSKDFQEFNRFAHTLPVIAQALDDPEFKQELLESLEQWRIRKEAEAEEYTEKQREKVLGQLPDTLSPEQQAEVRRRNEEYRKQQETKPEE